MNLYIDEEWYPGGSIFLHSYATDTSYCYQLYGRRLNQHNIERSLRLASQGIIFIYGPDIGFIEKEYGINIRDTYACINLLRVFKAVIPKRSSYKLADLEYDYGIARKVKKYKENIFSIYRDFNTHSKRQAVLRYNREDVINLRKLKEIIFSQYPISQQDLLTMRLT
jgi:hypothetical protein